MLTDYSCYARENLELARSIGINNELTAQLESIVRKLNRYDALATYVKKLSN